MYVEYEYKQTRRERSDILDFNKGRAVDWNILKDAININYDEFLALKSGGSMVTAQVYEAIVRYDGDDATGLVGSYEFSFATPTAAAVALRAYDGTQRLMTIKAGTYVAEDCLFVNGIISCDDGVTLQTGDNNAMFENIDGSYDDIDFQILGNVTITSVGSKIKYNITTSLNRLTIFANEDGDVTPITDIIKCNQLNVTAFNFAYKDIECSFCWIDASNIADFKIKGVNHPAYIDSIIYINTERSFNVDISDDLILASFNSIISFNCDEMLGSLIVNGIQEYFINIKKQTGTTTIGVDSGIYNLYIANSYSDSSNINILDTPTGNIRIKGLYENIGGLEIITCNTPVTVNVYGSLSMITTASPKVEANITLNDIQDY